MAFDQRVTPEIEARIVHLRKQGLTITVIAKRVGFSGDAVKKTLAKHDRNTATTRMD